VTLAGLARETSRIRLGTMVSSATFRPPGMLALTVATVDAMSGGRIEVGLGSGWFETEHRSFGIDFPPVAERFDVLTEQLEVLTGLWGAGAGTTYSFSGRHQVLTDNPALPRPVQQPHPPVIVGGKGKRRTPELAARFADEYNVPFDTPEVVAACFDRARAACTAAGRDPATLVLSAAQTLAVGRDDAEVRRRADAIQADPDELRAGGLGGTVAEVVDKIGRLADLGATRVYLQVLDLTDLEHLELVAAEVAPQL
jgi:alkanesulfonate monooxygenase SsuD/methylene tetrahydromethanopterin reductase-like flavin-dependent oxidoreductase (luciferase family)